MEYPMWVIVITFMGEITGVVGPFESQAEASGRNGEAHGSRGKVVRLRPGKAVGQRSVE